MAENSISDLSKQYTEASHTMSRNSQRLTDAVRTTGFTEFIKPQLISTPAVHQEQANSLDSLASLHDTRHEKISAMERSLTHADKAQKKKTIEANTAFAQLELERSWNTIRGAANSEIEEKLEKAFCNLDMEERVRLVTTAQDQEPGDHLSNRPPGPGKGNEEFQSHPERSIEFVKANCEILLLRKTQLQDVAIEAALKDQRSESKSTICGLEEALKKSEHTKEILADRLRVAQEENKSLRVELAESLERQKELAVKVQATTVDENSNPDHELREALTRARQVSDVFEAERTKVTVLHRELVKIRADFIERIGRYEQEIANWRNRYLPVLELDESHQNEIDRLNSLHLGRKQQLLPEKLEPLSRQPRDSAFDNWSEPEEPASIGHDFDQEDMPRTRNFRKHGRSASLEQSTTASPISKRSRLGDWEQDLDSTQPLTTSSNQSDYSRLNGFNNADTEGTHDDPACSAEEEQQQRGHDDPACSPEQEHQQRGDPQADAGNSALAVFSTLLLAWDSDPAEEEEILSYFTSLFSKGRPVDELLKDIDKFCLDNGTPGPGPCLIGKILKRKTVGQRTSTRGGCQYCKQHRRICLWAKRAPGVDPGELHARALLGGKHARWIIKKRRVAQADPFEVPWRVDDILV